MLLIMVVAPVFLFGGLFIDLARYKAADREAEVVVKAGARSVLAGYSSSLQSYGLYAATLDADKARDEFLYTARSNLSTSSPSFSLLDLSLQEDRTHVTAMYPIANHKVMKRQILEEMKYRAPLIYSLELLDKLKKTDVLTGIGQSSGFAENAARIEALLVQRDEAIDRLQALFVGLVEQSGRLHSSYQAQLQELNRLSEQIGLRSLADIYSDIEGTRAGIRQLEQEMDKADDTLNSLQKGKAAVELIRQAERTIENLRHELRNLENILSDLEQLAEDAAAYLEALAAVQAAAALDEEMLQRDMQSFTEQLNEAKLKNEALNDELRQVTSTQAGSDSGPEQVFNHVYLVPAQQLDTFGSQTAAAVSLFTGFIARISGEIVLDSEQYNAAMRSLDDFRSGLTLLHAQRQADEQERTARKESAEQSKQSSRNTAEKAFKQVKQVLGACSLPGGADPYQVYYEQLDDFVASYLAYNRELGAAASTVPLPEWKDPDRSGRDVLQLFKGVQDLLTDVRDEFYIDEFAVSKFSYRTLGLEKGVNGSIKQPSTLSEPASHPLNNQELEFLLYGANNCAANQSLAYAEMFAFRLAAGIADALLSPKSGLVAAGSPLAVLLAAIAEGAVQAQLDMTKLVQGEEVPVSKKLGPALTMNYKDYLRLFLLIHSKEEVLLARMQSLLQLNTGIDLKHTATYLTSKSEVSFQLWFIPELMQLAGKTGFSGCHTEQRRCLIVKTAAVQY